jgi:hypothetical protein
MSSTATLLSFKHYSENLNCTHLLSTINYLLSAIYKRLSTNDYLLSTNGYLLFICFYVFFLLQVVEAKTVALAVEQEAPVTVFGHINGKFL